MLDNEGFIFLELPISLLKIGYEIDGDRSLSFELSPSPDIIKNHSC
ncbi:hypothetical protein [Pleurocapsa sp. PCC 7319]|nr:hypothetical protein [Pleurocapsa sp. PCC 7319]